MGFACQTPIKFHMYWFLCLPLKELVLRTVGDKKLEETDYLSGRLWKFSCSHAYKLAILGPCPQLL